MKTLIATATLTIMFLSAGAFAGNDTGQPGGQIRNHQLSP